MTWQYAVLALAIVALAVAVTVYVIVTNRWPWQHGSYRNANPVEPIDRIMQRPAFSSRRYCNVCAANNVIASFDSDADLELHLQERHGYL